jgi:UDP-N-acetylmuramoylalanine--D-glutamate ligase
MELHGKHIAIVGMGQTAVALARFVRAHGGIPFVSEQRDASHVAAPLAALRALQVDHECGGHDLARIRRADVVVPSPGVDPAVAAVAEACAAGVPVVSEMELVFPYCRSKILAVTGTNGKTTTTELLAALVRAAGRSVTLTGNNALPFSEAAIAEPAPEFMVLEVSSYQLDLVRTFRPNVGAVLNLAPDHLARHKTMEGYCGAKNRMFLQQADGNVAVVNADDPRVRAMIVPAGVTRRTFSVSTAQAQGLWLDGDVIRDGDEAIAMRGDSPLPGMHNGANILAALTMARAVGLDWTKTIAGLRAFTGVEHRIELVATIAGVDYVNDSKATNVDSLRVSLESFTRPVVLIAGGQGKGSPYEVLQPLVKKTVKALVTIGEDAPKLEAAFHEIVPTSRASGMDDAIARAAALAVDGDVVLLSPACASFDMYNNFEHRGRVFKEAVEELAKRTTHCNS